jgi:uncharacterized membrane protein
MKNNAVLWSALLTVVAIVASLIVAPSLPPTVPVHWNASGQVDGYGSKAMMLWMTPAIMVGITIMAWAIPLISPKKFEIEPFSKAYVAIMIAIQLMQLCIHFILLRGAGNAQIDITRVMMPVMFVFFAYMGNWMGKIRQNYFMGVRTPWTLADERVWDQTHREAARLWFWGGIAGAVISALGTPVVVSVAIILVIALVPVYRSYAIAKKLGVVGT